MLGQVATAILVIGGSVGFCQWLMIRHLQASSWWIGFLITDLFLSFIVGSVIPVPFLNFVVPAMPFGLLTGLGIIALCHDKRAVDG